MDGVVELKPCPFCGDEAEYRYGSSTSPYIRCKRCGCRTGSSRDRTKLAQAWNARWERTCEMVDILTEFKEHHNYDEHAFRCGACHAEREVYAYDEEGNMWAEIPKRCPECGAKVVGR